MAVVYKKKYSLLIILIVIITLSVGCSVKIHDDYAFTEPSTSFSAGSIHGKLRGANRDIDKNHSSTGSPYELLLWFSINKPKRDISCDVRLTKIMLKNVEHNIEIPINPMANTTFRLRSNGNYTARIAIKNLELKYAMHELSFAYSFSEGCLQKELETKVKLEFRKNYKKRKG